MATALNFTQNNYGLTIDINIKKSDGSAMPLDNCSVEMDVVFPDKTKKRYTLPVVDELNGKAQLTITTEMTNQVGGHIGFIDIVSPMSKITLDGMLRYTVKAEDGGM